MKKILAAAALMGSLVVAAPASAEHSRGYGYGGYDGRGVNASCRNYGGGRDWICVRQNQIYRDMTIGMRTGRLSEREAGRLRAEFGHIARMEARYRRNGLQRWESADLLRRLDRLEWMVTAEMRDRNYHRG